MSSDNEVDRRWDEPADRGDLRTIAHRFDKKFHRIERQNWAQFILILGAIALTSLR